MDWKLERSYYNFNQFLTGFPQLELLYCAKWIQITTATQEHIPPDQNPSYHLITAWENTWHFKSIKNHQNHKSVEWFGNCDAFLSNSS